MKKIILVLFVIGMVFGVMDLESMSMFLLTKLIAILCMIPALLTLKVQE